MRKVFMWIRCAFMILPIWLTAVQSRKESFATRFAIIKHWANRIIKMSGYKLTVYGDDNIPDGTNYYVSNHEGSLDPFIIIATCTKPTTFISKKENLKIPVINSWMKTIECITFDRSSLRSSIQMIKDTTERLKNKQSVIVFPEGTRSKSSIMGEFKAGSLKPAFESQANIVPITLVNTYLIDVNTANTDEMKIVYGKPITYQEYKDLSTVELCNKIQEIIKRTLEG